VNPFTDTVIDGEANRRSSSLFRLALAFTPSDALRVTPAFYYQSIRIHDSPSFYVYLSGPGAGILQNGKLLRQPATDGFSLSAVKVEATLAHATLTSTTSYFNRTAGATVDETNAAGIAYYGTFGNPLGPAYPTSYADAVATQLQVHQVTWAQEIRLASLDTQARLAWLAGLFYFHADQDATHVTYAVTAPQAIGIYSDDHNIDTEAAVFGRITLALSKRWHASVGARAGWDKSDSTQVEGGFANSGTTPWLRLTYHETTAPTPRFDLTYNIDDDNMVYASLAEGFRKGAPNVPRPAQCHASSSYGPDSVWSREIGAKNALLNHRLQLATSVFYATWNEIQESIFDVCGSSYTVNAGHATSAGVDFTADALLGDRMRLGLTLERLDAHYTTTVMADNSVVVDRGTVIGSLPAVPYPWSGTAWLEYRAPLAHDLTIYARAEDVIHSHNPGPFTEGDPKSNNYDPTLVADPTTRVLNLYFGLVRSNLEVKVSLSNALNSQPILQRGDDATGSSLFYAYTLRPRTLALTLSQHF
jgi:outer membrane receptor protein involved in Fe transport